MRIDFRLLNVEQLKKITIAISQYSALFLFASWVNSYESALYLSVYNIACKSTISDDIIRAQLMVGKSKNEWLVQARQYRIQERDVR